MFGNVSKFNEIKIILSNNVIIVKIPASLGTVSNYAYVIVLPKYCISLI